MIQRIQTVFLMLVVVCMMLTLFFPLWESRNESPEGDLLLTAFAFSYGVEERIQVNFPYMFIAILAIASIVVAIIEISKYNNRLLQMKLGALNSLFMAGTVILAFWLTKDIIESFGAAGEYNWAVWLPVAAMLFNVIANRFIRKDEKLVKSADRIR